VWPDADHRNTVDISYLGCDALCASALKIEIVCPSESLLSACKSIWYHNPEELQ
jgi:hypothetical protein